MDRTMIMGYLVFFLVAATIIVVLNLYLGIRTWQGLTAWFPGLNRNVFIAIFCIISFSYVVGRLGSRVLPAVVAENLTIIGSYWMAVMFYGVLFLVVVDLLRLANHFLHFIPESWPVARFLAPVIALAIFAIIIWGAWNARHPVITHYDINLAKTAGPMEELHIVMVSDIHSGLILHNGRLAQLVQTINGLNPDLVVFPGDLIDEDVSLFAEENMADNFCKLQARYGVYACLGNHEYYSGQIEEVKKYLDKGCVQLLIDQKVEIADGIILIGRDNAQKPFIGMQNGNPAALKNILSGEDPGHPVVVLDHVPARFAEAKEAGVDLLLCGHTHKGQLWPGNKITEQIFPIDYGSYHESDFTAIVSSGFGTWGPPIRIGSRPEIVDITVHFGVQ